MEQERKRIDRMMWYFGWSPADLANFTGYSKHNIYHNMSKKPSFSLMETVERFEKLSKKATKIVDISNIKPERIREKGWHNLDNIIIKVFG